MSDIRADIEAAMANPDAAPADASDLPAVDTTPAPPIDTSTVQPPAEDRPRDEHGRFAKAPDKPAETPAAPEAPKAQPGAQPAQASTPATPAGAADRIAPPENWKGAAKVRWEGLPKPIQQEILADYARVGQIQQQFAAYQQVVGHRAERLAAEYGSPERAIEQLFALSDYATNDPQGFINWFAQTRGINLAGLTQQAQQPGMDPALAPHVQPLVQKISTLERQLSDLTNGQQRAVYETNLDSVKAFSADPAHPYVTDVWEDMVVLLESRRATSLEDAYQKATWANPAVREQMLTAEREKASQAANLDRARRAGVALNGSPVPGASTAASGPERSLRDDLVSNAREAGWHI